MPSPPSITSVSSDGVVTFTAAVAPDGQSITGYSATASPIVNILPVNNAWRARTNSTISASTASGVTVTSVAAGDFDADNNTTQVPVTAGNEYTFTADAAKSGTGGNRSVRLAIEWISSTSTLVGISYDQETLVPAVQAPLSVTATAPAGAVRARILLRGVSASASGEIITWSSVAVDDGDAAAPTPTLVSHSVSGVGSTFATVTTATTNATEVRLDLALNSGFTGASATTVRTPDGSGVATHPLTGLTAGTTYYYRVVANGTVLTGGSFATEVAEAVTSQAVSDITATSATVTVTSTATDQAYLEYATDSGFTTPIPTSPVAPDGSGISVHQITGLTPETGYWYRIRLDDVIFTGDTFTTAVLVEETGTALRFHGWGGTWIPAGTTEIPPGVDPPPPASTSLRIDVGGEGETWDGKTWTPDTYVNGVVFTTTDTSQLENLPAIFQTHRYGNPAVGPLAISAPTTFEQVLWRLHFVEPSFGAIGRRVFDILTPAGPVMRGLDIFARVGRGAVFTTEVVAESVDGLAMLTMPASIDNAILAAFELLDGTGRALTPILPTTPPPSLTIVYRTSNGTLVPLNGQLLPTQSATVQVSADATISGPVNWHLDEVIDGTPTYVSAASPWVYNGGTATFSTGEHTLRAVVTLTGGGTVTLTATFEAPSSIIVNPPPPTGGVVTDSVGYQLAPAERPINAIGVNLHPEYPEYYNVPGGNDAIIDLVTEMGARHIRCMPHSGSASSIRRAGERGIKTWATIGHSGHGTPTGVVSVLNNDYRSTLYNNIEYIEGLLGPNEVDNSDTRGTTSNMKNTMIALWNAVKGNSVLAHLDVATISMTWPGDPSGHASEYNAIQGIGDISQYISAIDFHPYPGGIRADTNNRYGKPRAQIDLEAMLTLIRSKWRTPLWTDYDYKKPEGGYAIASEMGGHTNVAALHGHKGAPRNVWAVYMPADVFYYDKLGIARHHLYEMVNEEVKGNEQSTSSEQGSYGQVTGGNVPMQRKPSFYALKNLIALMGDKGPAFTPGKLDVTVTGDAQTRWAGYQKRNGRIYLTIYQAFNIYDVNARAYQPKANVNVTVRLNRRSATVRTHVPYYLNGPTTTTTSASTTLQQGANYTVAANAWVTILEIIP